MTAIDHNADPMLISGIRLWPTGDIQHIPTGGIGKTGTSAAGFLAEYDEALAAAYAAGYRDGYAISSQDTPAIR